jgi:uncharacterized protein (DUF2267 family)
MARNYDSYARQAQKLVETLALDLGNPQDIDKAKRLLKAVLHTIRDRIIIAESFQLMAQLPTLIKGIYVENWKYSEKPENFRTKHSLFQALIRSEHLSVPGDFPNEDYAVFAVNMVFKNLSRYISRGELEDVMAGLPTEIKDVIDLKSLPNN